MIKNNNTDTFILVEKSKDLRFTYCNKVFLRYTGLSSEEKALGLTDYDLPWQNYAEIYHKHELDALSGQEYSTIVPIKDCKSTERIFLNTKIPKKDKGGKIIGTITHAMEIITPSVFEFFTLLQKSLTDGNNFNSFLIKDSFLSSRESECLFYLLRGQTAKKIAGFLKLSPKTVEHYIENIKLKFHCRTKPELISEAIERGFINMVPKTIFSEKINKVIKKITS